MTGADETKHTILLYLVQARAKNLPVLQGKVMMGRVVMREH